MGPGFVIIIWVLLLAAVCAAWLVALLLLVLGWKKKWPWLKWPAAVPVVLLPLGVALAACLFVYGIIRASIPSCVFKDHLNSVIPADVSALRSQIFWFADTGHTRLKFECSETTFEKLVPEDLRDHRASSEDLRSSYNSTAAPRWWRNPASFDIIYHRAESTFDGGKPRVFASEATTFCYDRGTREAQFEFLGID